MNGFQISDFRFQIFLSGSFSRNTGWFFTTRTPSDFNLKSEICDLKSP